MVGNPSRFLSILNVYQDFVSKAKKSNGFSFSICIVNCWLIVYNYILGQVKSFLEAHLYISLYAFVFIRCFFKFHSCLAENGSFRKDFTPIKSGYFDTWKAPNIQCQATWVKCLIIEKKTKKHSQWDQKIIKLNSNYCEKAI